MPQVRPPHKSERLRVLVVDDHVFIRRGVCGLFAEHPDFEVCAEAANGQEAINQVRKLNPHVVILDISMPVMTGLEAAAEIRRIAPTTRIVMLTMHDGAAQRDLARKAGADAFVTKTEAASQLIQVVRSVLGVQSAVE